jgi:hypothetical protein
MTRKIRPFDEEKERGYIRGMGYTFDELQAWAARYDAQAVALTATAESELKLREFETTRGKKWAATYFARRCVEQATRAAARARLHREIAESTPTCELPEATNCPIGEQTS